jgi:hypothetical protein
MKARTYALTLIAACAGVFLAVVGANLMIDPQGVFGTGLFGRALNANDRYARVVAYQAAPDRYDGLLFGSSRAFDLPLDELSRRMNGATFAKFAVVGGMPIDHVAALEYVLRDKAAKGRRLRAVFLLLDIDFMGNSPFTNSSNQFLMHPALSGENPARFWWKNLASIQFKAWRSAIVDGSAGARSAARGVIGIAIGVAHAQTVPLAIEPDAGERKRITDAAEFPRHLRSLERLVALCRAHGIELVVAASPLHPENARRFAPADFAHAVELVRRIVPLWDFTDLGGLSGRRDLWGDVSHFRPEVAHMMIRRIFGDPLPGAWSGFGRFRSR